jgi:protein-S-isoprenylcysteine O-methyltransferase Ste14
MIQKILAKLNGIEGAGPKIMAPLIITFAITTWISYAYQTTFNYPVELYHWLMPVGALMLVIGVPFWLLSVAMFLRAWFGGRLETRGPFAIMPNPIYGSWIVLIIPGIALFVAWWPILLTSVVTFAAHRLFIREEDDALRQKFGRPYEEYRKNVLIKFL